MVPFNVDLLQVPKIRMTPVRSRIADASTRAMSNEQGPRDGQLFKAPLEPRAIRTKGNLKPLKRQGAVVWGDDTDNMRQTKRSRDKDSVT